MSKYQYKGTPIDQLPRTELVKLCEWLIARNISLNEQLDKDGSFESLFGGIFKDKK